jgi:hypothetical protein
MQVTQSEPVKKSLIRIGVTGIVPGFNDNETLEVIEDKEELHHLYANHIARALIEVKAKGFTDLDGYVEIIQAALILAKINGIENVTLLQAMKMKAAMFGEYGNLVKVTPNPF